MSNDEEQIIRLNHGGRYQVVGKSVYSLNYAERGMLGCSRGKKLPDELADKVIGTWKKEEAYRRGRVSVSVKAKAAKSSKKKSTKKYKKKSAATKATKKTGISLGSLLK